MTARNYAEKIEALNPLTVSNIRTLNRILDEIEKTATGIWEDRSDGARIYQFADSHLIINCATDAWAKEGNFYAPIAYTRNIK